MFTPVVEQQLDPPVIEVERLMEWYMHTDSKGEATIQKRARAALFNIHQRL